MPPVDESQFWRRRSVRRMLAGLGSVAAVIAFGVIGYVANGWTASDALFMVVITISGVGYGEVHPLTSAPLRIHTMLVIVFGVAAMAYTLARFVQFVTEGEIRRLLGLQRVRHQIDSLRGHTIVVGCGRMGELVCEELHARELPFVVIERNPDVIAEVERHGFLYVHGDATDEEALRRAGLDRAKTIVTAVSSDSDSVFITLTARQLARDVVIIARAEVPSTQKKLRQAGANHVILPAAIGAHRIASLLTNPTAVEFAELVTHRSQFAIELEELPVRPDGPLVGLSPAEADIRRRTGVIVVAIKRADGTVDFAPPTDSVFSPGDTVVVLGRRSNLDHFRKVFGLGAET